MPPNYSGSMSIFRPDLPTGWAGWKKFGCSLSWSPPSHPSVWAPEGYTPYIIHFCVRTPTICPSIYLPCTLSKAPDRADDSSNNQILTQGTAGAFLPCGPTACSDLLKFHLPPPAQRGQSWYWHHRKVAYQAVTAGPAIECLTHTGCYYGGLTTFIPSLVHQPAAPHQPGLRRLFPNLAAQKHQNQVRPYSGGVHNLVYVFIDFVTKESKE